jgi:glutamate-ammonia-ligase adenylyltransferase
MRDKMRVGVGTPEARQKEIFHIKNDEGGIVDIEFMVQYLMLAWCSVYPDLTCWSDNIRQMEALGQVGIIPLEDTEKLRRVFIALRSTTHRRALQDHNSQVEGDAFTEEREYVKSMWKRVMVS